jgi:hypothetical protein
MLELRQTVANALQKLANDAPSLFWRGVFAEMSKRWTHREQLEVGDEITVYVHCPNTEIQSKVMERAQEFAPLLEFDDASAKTRLIVQKYNARGGPKVILRLRILPITVKRRAKFVVTDDAEI